jgi:pyruvate,water dikinase
MPIPVRDRGPSPGGHAVSALHHDELMVRIEYSCADGTPFPVTFATADDVTLEWRLEREHSTGPGTPLAVALGRLGRPGADRAYTEAGLPVPDSWREGPQANGFPYFVAAPPSPDEMAALFAGCGRLVEQYGSALGIWREYSLPRVQASCAWLTSAPLDTSVAELAVQHDYALHHTMVSSMVTWNDLRLVAEVIGDLFGADAQLVAGELAQGYENDTTGADEELWRLARLAATDAVLTAALSSSDPSDAMAQCRDAGDHHEFFAGLDRFLGEYGARAEMWTIDAPTWREQGEGFWAQVRHLARDGAPDLAAARRRAVERRESLVASITTRLAGDETRRGRFERRVERLASYVPVREDRARWQLVAAGSLRDAMRRRGAALVSAGRLDRVDDVFFLLPDELDDHHEPAGGWRDRIAQRRIEHARWRALDPPLVIGTRLEPSGGDALAPATVRGIGAARGVATGRARVVLDLSDAGRLAPGEVLVCTMTSPPWTPLFAVAAALVTDTGTIESHPAIAAREYGLPCVVGTEIGTTAIRDGALVTVDGTAGTVEITR